LANTINITVAQRLVRLLCPNCKKELDFDSTLFPPNFDYADKQIHKHYIAAGCDQCYYTGYKGRRAIYEIIPVDNELAGCIKNKQLDIAEVFRRKGIITLSDGAFELVNSGLSSIDECYSLLMNQI
jgi:general secretion pathway protein E/type IV pilus assembly protein PilB